MPASARSLQHDAIVPSTPQQQGLPTGPTHVASRAPLAPRTPAEVESNRAFLAAAGRVEFGRYEATLERVWMAFVYFASLSDDRLCYATVEHIAEKARRSGRTVRRHVPALMGRGLVQCGARKGGRTPSTWSVVLPADVRGLTPVSPFVRGGQDVLAGRTECPGRADTVSDNIRDREKIQESTSSRARVVCLCGNSWPNKAEYGTRCYQCGHDPSTGTPADNEPQGDEPPACTCGDAYHNSYGRRCVNCKGEPSGAQRDALREKDGGVGENEGVGVDRGVVRAAGTGIDAPPLEAVASTPTLEEIVKRLSPETPPDGGKGEDETPPKSDRDALLRFWKKERAKFNRKHHIGETDDGQTDDRTEASGVVNDGREAQGQGAD